MDHFGPISPAVLRLARVSFLAFSSKIPICTPLLRRNYRLTTEVGWPKAAAICRIERNVRDKWEISILSSSLRRLYLCPIASTLI